MPQTDFAIAAAVGSAWVLAGGREQGLVFCNSLAANKLDPTAVAIFVVGVSTARSVLHNPTSPAAAAIAIGTAAVSYANPDAAAVVGAAASIAHATAHAGKGALLLFEAIAIVWFVTVGQSFSVASTHLTWWNMTALAVFDIVAVVSPRSTQKAAPAFAVIAATVVVGVAVMSITQCTLLTTTYSELGWLQYTAGNTIVHFYPLVRAAAAIRSWEGALAGIVVVQ